MRRWGIWTGKPAAWQEFTLLGSGLRDTCTPWHRPFGARTGVHVICLANHAGEHSREIAEGATLPCQGFDRRSQNCRTYGRIWREAVQDPCRAGALPGAKRMHIQYFLNLKL